MRKKITTGICLILRGLFFSHNAEIGKVSEPARLRKDHLWMDTNYKEEKKPMPFIKPPDLEQVDGSTKEIYEKVKEYTGSDSVSEVIRVLSLRPDLLNMTLSMVGTLLTAKTELDNEIKEAIAILTSLENGCKICVGEHARIAKELGMKEEIVDKLAKGIEFIEFPEKEKKLLKFCVKSAKNAYKVLQKDIDTLRKAGYSGSQILEALCIVGYFNYMNTIMLATGSTS